MAVPAAEGFVVLFASSWIVTSWDDGDVVNDSTISRRDEALFDVCRRSTTELEGGENDETTTRGDCTAARTTSSAVDTNDACRHRLVIMKVDARVCRVRIMINP